MLLGNYVDEKLLAEVNSVVDSVIESVHNNFVLNNNDEPQIWHN